MHADAGHGFAPLSVCGATLGVASTSTKRYVQAMYQPPHFREDRLEVQHDLIREPIRGCAFAPRCRLRVDACGEWPARLEVHAPDQLSACLRHAEPTSARFEVVS